MCSDHLCTASETPGRIIWSHFFVMNAAKPFQLSHASTPMCWSRLFAGSETPSRTSWSHFFVKDAAKHALIVSAEAQIEALFKSEAVRGPFPPLTKVEALQGERIYPCTITPFHNYHPPCGEELSWSLGMHVSG